MDPGSELSAMWYHTPSLSFPNISKTLYACRDDDQLQLNDIELRATERLHMYLWILQIRLDKMYCPRRFIRYFMEMVSISNHPSGNTMFYLLLCSRIQYGSVIYGISESVQDLGPILQHKYINDPMSEFKVLQYEDMDPRAKAWFHHGRNSAEYKNVTLNYSYDAFFSRIEPRPILPIWSYHDFEQLDGSWNWRNYDYYMRNDLIDLLVLKLNSSIIHDMDEVLQQWLNKNMLADVENLVDLFKQHYERVNRTFAKSWIVQYTGKLADKFMKQILADHGYVMENFIVAYSSYEFKLKEHELLMDMYIENRTQVNAENLLIAYASRLCNGVHDPAQFPTHEQRLARSHVVLRAFTRYFK